MNYFRVGNRTFTQDEIKNITPSQLKVIEEAAKVANDKRLENMRKGLGLEPQKMTIDVTPQGVAKRLAAIKAEEEKIAMETKAIEEELGPDTKGFIAEAEKPVPAKKSKKSKTVEKETN